MNSSRSNCLHRGPRRAVTGVFLQAALGCSQLAAPAAMAQLQEATAFSVPSGSPDEYMQAGAAFARELDSQVKISFRDAQSGSLSVSRVDGDSVECILRTSPGIAEALRPLGRFLNGRIDPKTQAMFALAHEVGHCKLRDALLNRADGHAGDASVFPWIAQEAAADVYGILSIERQPGGAAAVREAVVISRMLSSAMYRDPHHATGHYVSDSLALCHRNLDDRDAVQCAIATAYYTVGSLDNDAREFPYAVDSKPELFYELGVQAVSKAIRVYENIAQYKAQFSGADLSRYAFDQISRDGDSRYITAFISDRNADATRDLADYYGFRMGEVVTDDQQHVTALRIDGAEELDWLLTLGAVVRTGDGGSLRKRDTGP
jgi:hypothetical protein